jgi:hypothetical protein
MDAVPKYDSDWYVQLCVPGLIQKQHDLVPEAYRQSPTGMYVTFVVADVDQVYAQAQAMSPTISL